MKNCRIGHLNPTNYRKREQLGREAPQFFFFLINYCNLNHQYVNFAFPKDQFEDFGFKNELKCHLKATFHQLLKMLPKKEHLELSKICP